MSEKKTFYCLRCQHRFAADHEPKRVVERSCPACGSNSVRLETAAAARSRAAAARPRQPERREPEPATTKGG